MKTFIFSSLFFVLMLSTTFSIAGNKWYSGGSLHRSTVLQWKEGTQANRIATAADWALTRQSIKSKVQNSGSMDTLKPYANSLVQCINEAGQGNEYNTVSTSELAAACMIMMKW